MASLRLPPLPTVRELLKLYKISAMKKFSQNFILDENLTNKIISKVGKLAGGQVLEVGPGPGSLTRSIMRHGPKRLVVVEKDIRFKPTLDMLNEAYQQVNGEMDIIFEDILKVDLSDIFPNEERKLWDETSPKINIIGNLPFSVSTYLIIKWLRAISEKSGAWSYGRTRMMLTFQREVAERLIAQPSDKQRCRLSIMAQAWSFPVLHFCIPGQAFVPKPDVDVGVVSFIPLVKPRTKHEFSFFEKVTRHLFQFRQKCAIKCVRTLFPPECCKEMAALVCKLADLEDTIKPTQLTVEDVDRIATAYKYILELHPEFMDFNHRASRAVLSQKQTADIQVEEYVPDFNTKINCVEAY